MISQIFKPEVAKQMWQEDDWIITPYLAVRKSSPKTYKWQKDLPPATDNMNNLLRTTKSLSNLVELKNSCLVDISGETANLILHRPSGKRVFISCNLLSFVEKMMGRRTYKFYGGKEALIAPVRIVVDGEVVGIIMPIRTPKSL